MATTNLLTAADLAEMPDDGYQYELIRGVLAKMPPPGFEHGALGHEIAWWLENFVRPRGLGRVVVEAGFWFENDPDLVMAPDVAFVRTDRLPPRQERTGYLTIPPDLAVEVVSPSQSEPDVVAKAAEYLRLGVPLVWAVFPRRQSATVFRAGRAPRVVNLGEALDGEDVLSGFRLPLADIFRDLP